MVGRNIAEHPDAAGWNLLLPRRPELDLLDNAAVLAYVDRHHPDAIVHAAGRVGGIHANISHPVEFLVENTDMGRNVIMAAMQVGVPAVLNLGSSCMYPRDVDGLLREEMILTGELEPTNEGYAIGKIFAARLCDYIRRTRPELQYKTLIPSNLYGRYDKFDPRHSHLIPAIIHKVHEARRTGATEVEIWGDGTARREFLYAGDLADAIWRAIGDVESLPGYLNIGLGADYSVNEYYAAVAEVIGWGGRFVHDLSKPVGMRRKQVDVGRQTEWGWRPGHSLREGLAKTYQYYRETL